MTEGSGREDKQEKVVALPHEALLALSSKTGHPVTDPWCMKLAGAHLRRMIAAGQDLEKTLITLAPADLEQAAGLRAAA